MIELTDPQLKAMSQSQDEPPRFVDPRSQRSYVLVPLEVFERLAAALSDDPDPRAAYPAIDRVFAEDWNDPRMDDYDRYDELKK